MKPLLFTLGIIFNWIAASAQVDDNAPWCPAGATWTYSYFSMSSTVYRVFKYNGVDTVIQGQASKILSETNLYYGFAGPNGQGAYSGSRFLGNEYYRQSGDSIFWWTGSGFQLIWRLRPQTGDSWTTGNPRSSCSVYPAYPLQDTVKVRSVRKDTLNGRIYSRATVSTDSGYYLPGYPSTGRILSGIGSLEYPYPQFNLEKCYFLGTGIQLVDWGSYFYLACYSDPIRGTVPMIFPPAEGCAAVTALATSVATVSAKALGIRSWPNPVDSRLFLDGVPLKSSYELLTTEGRLLRSGAVTNCAQDLSTLRPGVYLFRITGRSGDAVIKVVKR